MKVFLGDLVHTWEKVSLWTFPLNIGFIGEYAKKMLPGPVEITLFKRPELMIEAIRKENPDVVALSYYVWNANLNTLVFDIAKQNDTRVLTVGGGPIFTNANATDPDARRFFAKNPSCDAFVLNQGERGFAELLHRYLDIGGDVDRLRGDPVSGCLVNNLHGADRIQIGETLDIIRDLDEIPSPYLSGMLDSFFEEPFVPILETNRSCPYRCTFCAWGIGTGKLAQFGEERVLAEIEYIGQHCAQSMNLFIADANFSILDRDAVFAKSLRQSHEKNGYPGHVAVQWNKTRPDRVLKVARELNGIADVGASMQSLQPAVLDAIKRRNLPLDAITKLVDTLRSEGLDIPLFTELILGLPNETRQSHIDANKTMIDLGAEIFNYNLHLLPGTEMDSVESRATYFKQTVWRLHDNAFGIYDGVNIFEGQEVVDETSTMTAEELRSFRFIHFLIQFMWSRKWYYDFLQLFRQVGVHPVDLIARIAEAFRHDGGEMGALFKRFEADHELERFENFEALADYWTKDENMECLRTGEYGKLNYHYTYQILLDHNDAFNAFLGVVSVEMVAELALADPEIFLSQCDDVLSFTAELRVTISQKLDRVVEAKRRSFAFDFLAWRKNGYSGQPARISTSDRYDYEFFLSDPQRSDLERQLSQFRSHSRNLTLRKMSEYIKADHFFYNVRNAQI